MQGEWRSPGVSSGEVDTPRYTDDSTTLPTARSPSESAVSETGDHAWRSTWQSLWRCLAALEDYARRLRHLSQEEPLLQARPDYPRARSGRSYAADLREVFRGLSETLGNVQQSLPIVLPDGQAPAGVAPDEAPRAIRARLGALARLLKNLEHEAFEPPPPLPQHAPPYLAAAPSHDLAGSKAVLLSQGIEEAVAALRNTLLGALNATTPPIRTPPPPEA